MIELVLPLAAAVLSGSTVGAILTYLSSRHKAPVERESAHAAASAELAEAAAALVEPLSAEVKRLDARVQQAERDAAHAREDAAVARREAASMSKLAASMSKLAGEADDYIRDLHARWEQHRTGARPPYWRWLEPTTPPTLD